MGRKPTQAREPRSHMWEGSDGKWHAFVVVGRRPNGEADRRHREAPDRDLLIPKVLELEDAVDDGNVPKPGKSKTLEAWLHYWLAEVAPLHVRYKTLASYRSNALVHLIPRLGQWRLSELRKRHFAQLYLELQQEGDWTPSTIHSVHRTASTALNRAIDLEEPGISANPAQAAKSALPKLRSDSVIPLDAGEVQRITAAVAEERNHVRWWIAFLGARQGEVLGLRWSDVDWDTGIINIRRQLQRQTYSHGCARPQACAKPHCTTAEGCDQACKYRKWDHGCPEPERCAALHCGDRQRKNPCPPGCVSHARSCPRRRRSECSRQSHRTACPDNCIGHARHCPERRGGLVLTEPERPEKAAEGKRTKRARRSQRDLRPKSEAGERRMPMPEVVLNELRVHQARQEMEREEAGSMWADLDLIFTTRLGGPIDPSADWEAWGEILDEAGVDYIHLHGARHSAATFLGGLGVDPVIRMAMLGWASPEMAKRYQHVSDADLMAAANRLGAAAFRPSATGSATGVYRDGSG